jgi:hypothetical protein
MRSYVEDNQEIGRMHVQMLTATDQAAGRAPSRALSRTWWPSPHWCSALSVAPSCLTMRTYQTFGLPDIATKNDHHRAPKRRLTR